ncbi:Zonadhesin [Trichinella spiralis]|uniref:Zonadhesin n=1 Tax=Trichinella spiralis TaxID=6334 RepID=A0ABR3KIF8_TRISP
MEKEMSVKQHMMSKEKSETKLRTQVTPFQLQKIAQFMEEQNIVEQVVAQRDFKEQTKVEERIKKADPKKRKSKSAKKYKSTKTKKEKIEMMIEKDISSKKQKSKLEDEIVQWTPEVKAQATESNRLIDRMSRIRLSEKEKKAAERIGEEQSRKEKKKSKKKSKSKKSKKNETELTLKQHMNKQTHETEIAVMEAPTATEITAAVSDEAVIVQPITVERKPDVFIQEVQKTEKKDSKKIKKKSKKRSKSKKTKKTEKDTAAKEAASSQIPETDITSPKLALASEVTAVDVDQPNIVPRIPEETAEKPVITVEPKDIAAKEAASSQIPETDITSPKLTLASEVTAINVDQLDIVPPIAEETDEKPVITDIPKGEKKDSKKIKKKSKKRTKSKKTKKTEKDITAKEAASSQVTETDNKSPKFTQASEVTAVDIDQPNIVPPIAEETAEKPVITVEPKGEKKDSKKIKKKSKKRTKSKKTKKTEKDIAAKEAASSQIPETDITSPNLALASEVTATNVDQLDIVPSIAEETDKKPVITVEPKAEKKDSKKIKKKSKKRTKSKKTKETEKDIAAKEAASSQIPETDITSPNLALANEKPVITDIPKGEKKDSEKIKKKSKKRTKSKKTKKTEKDRAAKEGATSQVTETDITSPKFTLASEDTADEPKGEKKDSKKIKKKSKKRTKSKKTKKTEKDIAAKEAASSQETETDITSRKLALASEVTAINVDQLDIVPSIAEETDEKPVITVNRKIKKKSKKRTKSKKTKETEKDIAAKEAASSQIPETDITSPNLALASEVTAINVDQLDIVPSIPEETDEKPVITDIPKETDITSPNLALASEVTAINVDQLDIVPSIPEETDEKPVITVEPKDTAAKEGATSQVTETDITSPKFTLASEDTAVDVDQQNIVPTIPEETVEKPLLKDEPKGEKKDSKKIKKKSKKRTKSKKTKKTEKDIAAKEAASSQETETDITSRKLALASEVTAINVDQLDIVPSIAKETDEKPVITGEPKGEKKDSKKIKKKSKKRSKSKKTKKTEKDTAAKEAASSQETETDITSRKLALASEVTAINVDQLDIVKSIAKETDEKPVITVEPKAEKKDSKKIKKKSKKRTKSKKTKETEKDIAAKEAASSQIPETDITSRKLALASEVTAINVDQLDIVPSIAKETDEKPVITGEPKGEKKDSKKIKKKSMKRSKSKKTKRTEKDIAAKEAASSQVTETDITSPNLALASEVTAINVDQLDIAPSIPEETDEKPVITDIPKGEKKDSKKIKKKSKKRTKSKKTKKTEKDVAAKEAASSQMTETDNKSSKFTLASEVTAVDVDQQNIVPTIPEETVEKPLLKDEPKVEKKDSKKIKKKSKKRTKSKKTKKTDKGKGAKEAASSHVTETDNKSPKFTLASEVTAVDVDQPNIVPPIPEETAEKPVITGEPKEKQKAVEDTAAKEAASSQVTETDNKSPKFTLASEVTAVDVEQPVIVPRTAEDAVKKLVINDEPKGEKKDSKKIKKRSKKRSKSKKSNKSVEDKVAK